MSGADQAAPDFSRRELELPERMDQPDCDLRVLHRTYARFRIINALVSGWRQLYLRELRPLLLTRRGNAQSLTLLDIGCGGGDVPLNLARWARRDGLRLQVTAIDADARAIRYAGQVPAQAGVSFRRAMSGDLVREGQRFDFVTSNHLLHHLTAPELTSLLSDSEQLCRVTAIHGDIERSPVAYAAFRLGTALFFPGTFIHEDGLLSIRRSYTRAELAALAPPGWVTGHQPPFRNLLMYRAPAAQEPSRG